MHSATHSVLVGTLTVQRTEKQQGGTDGHMHRTRRETQLGAHG